MKYHLVTLGCQMNKSDSERVSAVIEKMGYQWTDLEEEANFIGVLACSVRQKSIDKVYSKIAKWNKWKDSKNLITFVSGCVLPADREKFMKLFDLVFQVSELNQLPEMLHQYGIVTRPASSLNDKIPEPVKVSTVADFAGIKIDSEAKSVAGAPVSMNRPEERIMEFWDVNPHYNSRFEAFIPIQNGCDKFCTFCAVPYTRGREISRPSGEILSEIERLIAQDYKLITLLGQNVNSYGLDKKGEEISFAQLLERIGNLGEKSGREFWVYFTSPHPRDMTDDVLQVISQYKCLANQIHLPLQSGDDKVLIHMNRKHSLSDYRKIIHSINKYLPEATIFTDIIVGFTGETDEQFENSRKAMEEFKFNMAYIAKYSPRPGAASSRWADDVPDLVKKKRLGILSEELKKHTHLYNRQLIGKTLKVIVTGKDRKEGFLSGMTEGRIVLRFASGNESLVGQYVFLKINSATAFALEGELVEETVTEMS